MNPYLIKTIIELAALICLYVIATGLDQRITVLEKEKEREIADEELIKALPPLSRNVYEPSLSSKIKKEEKRMMNYADDTVHGKNHRFTTKDMNQKKKNHIYYMRAKAKRVNN